VAAYGQSQAGDYASALAFNAFVSMFPLMLGVLSIVGFVMRSPREQARIQDAIIGFFPADAHTALAETLAGIQGHPGILGIVSVIGLIYSGTNLFASMEWVLGAILGTSQRGFVGQRLMGLTMTAIFAASLVASVGVTSAVALFPRVPFGASLVGALVFFLLFFAIYRIVPREGPGWRRLLPGAVIGAVLAEALTLLWPLYTALSHNFNAYGAAFALFLLLATWLYFLSQLILVGALVNRLLTEA
jgi:membrane protein